MTIDPKVEKKFLKTGSTRLTLPVELPPRICIPPRLNALPTAVHNEVFNYLTGHEMAVLSRVNKRFRFLIQDERVWRRLLNRDFPTCLKEFPRPNKKRRVDERQQERGRQGGRRNRIPEDDEQAHEGSNLLRSRTGKEAFIIERGVPVCAVEKGIDYRKEYQVYFKQLQWSLRKKRRSGLRGREGNRLP